MDLPLRILRHKVTFCWDRLELKEGQDNLASRDRYGSDQRVVQSFAANL